MRTYLMTFDITSRHGTESRTFSIGSVSGARFSSRQVEAMRQHLDQAIVRDGHYTVATQTNPSIFHVGRYLLTQDDEFEVQGPLSGGEAEVVAVREGHELFITLGSDQCDRELDALFPDKPKQMCPHPIATTAWPYDEVKDHWDQMRIYSHVVVEGHEVTLQDSPIVELVDLEYLLGMDGVKILHDAMVLYCGASEFLEEAIAKAIKQYDLPPQTAHGIGDTFLARLHDPVLGRTIEHTFRTVPLGDELPERTQVPIRQMANAPEHVLRDGG